MYGCESSDLFVIKALMRERPFTFTSAFFLYGIIIFGYALKVTEGPLIQISKDMDHSYLINSCWESILVMTTGKKLHYLIK